MRREARAVRGSSKHLCSRELPIPGVAMPNIWRLHIGIACHTGGGWRLQAPPGIGANNTHCPSSKVEQKPLSGCVLCPRVAFGGSPSPVTRHRPGAYQVAILPLKGPTRLSTSKSVPMPPAPGEGHCPESLEALPPGPRPTACPGRNQGWHSDGSDGRVQSVFVRPAYGPP